MRSAGQLFILRIVCKLVRRPLVVVRRLLRLIRGILLVLLERGNHPPELDQLCAVFTDLASSFTSRLSGLIRILSLLTLSTWAAALITQKQQSCQKNWP